MKASAVSRTKGLPAQCAVCLKWYSSKKSLKIHSRTHTGCKPYKCNLCPKKFAQANVLKAHINAHLGRRDYVCDVCGKAFIQSAHLRTHKQIHTKIKEFSCSFCDKGFCSKGILDRHCRSHTGEKPYSCMTCRKSFSRRESLKAHEISTHPVTPEQQLFLQYEKTQLPTISRLKKKLGNSSTETASSTVCFRKQMSTQSTTLKPVEVEDIEESHAEKLSIEPNFNSSIPDSAAEEQKMQPEPFPHGIAQTNCCDVGTVAVQSQSSSVYDDTVPHLLGLPLDELTQIVDELEWGKDQDSDLFEILQDTPPLFDSLLINSSWAEN